MIRKVSFVRTCAEALVILLVLSFLGTGSGRAQPTTTTGEPTTTAEPPPAGPTEASPSDTGAPSPSPSAPAADPEPTPAGAEPDDTAATAEGYVPEGLMPIEGEELEESRSLIEEDVEPTVSVFSGEEIDIRIGGLVQVFAAPFVGDDALIENGDPSTSEGFRLRRARLGFDARFRLPLRIQLTVDLLQSSEALSDAKISYELYPWLRFSVGTGKVPFARGELESSRRLSTIERPLAVTEIAPGHRLGATVEGQLLGDRLAYVAGVMNGTEGFIDGNQYGGLLAGARLQYVIFGEPSGLEVRDGIAVGTSAFYEDAPATDGYAVAADLLVALAGFELVAEGLWDTRKPDDAPEVSPSLADQIERRGAYLTALYRLPTLPLEPVARVEFLDDNTDVEDAGDVLQISGGVNSQLIDRFVRAQLHYIRRVERYGRALGNNAIVLSVMGVF
jgi:hypothetical protein